MHVDRLFMQRRVYKELYEWFAVECDPWYVFMLRFQTQSHVCIPKYELA